MIQKNETVVLCSRRRRGGCCPEITRKEKGGFEIKDDYDGKVFLTDEEILLLRDVLNKIALTISEKQ